MTPIAFSRSRLDQLPPGTDVGVLPGCGHVPMSDNPRAVVTIITQSAARAATEPQARAGDR